MNAYIDISSVILETKRLILRPFKEEDLNDFYEYAKVDGVGQMAGWNPHLDIKESEFILNLFIKSKKTFAIVLKENNKVIGSIGIDETSIEEFVNDKRKCREIGYVLSKDYWNNGYMSEAVKEVIDYCFNSVHLDYLVCCHFIENTRSKRVIEKNNFIYVRDTMYRTNNGQDKLSKVYKLENE